jgi:tetratricopeptide (TPR) repeat protein
VTRCSQTQRFPLERGDLERAIPLLERGFALCRATDLHLWAAETAADLGYSYALAGRFDDAAPILEAALAEAKATDLQFTYARQHALAGEAYWIGGDVANAERLAIRALEVARAHKQRGQEARSLHLSALIADDAKAEARFGEALRLASALGMLPLVAHCHFGLGRLSRSIGKREQAHEHLTTATRMYRDMGMTYWLEKAEAEMRELG